MFHYGASIGDKSGLPEGDGKVARVVRFTDMKDIEKKKKKPGEVVKKWMKLKDAD